MVEPRTTVTVEPSTVVHDAASTPFAGTAPTFAPWHVPKFEPVTVMVLPAYTVVGEMLSAAGAVASETATFERSRIERMYKGNIC